MTYLKCDLSGKPIVPSKGDKPIPNVDYFYFQEKILSKESLEKWNKMVSDHMAEFPEYSFRVYKEEIFKLKDQYLCANN